MWGSMLHVNLVKLVNLLLQSMHTPHHYTVGVLITINTLILLVILIIVLNSVKLCSSTSLAFANLGKPDYGRILHAK